MILVLIRVVVLTLITFLLPTLATAAATTWTIVSADSKITFTATQNNAPVSGIFKTFTGTINFDPAQLASSNVHIVVDMNSVITSYNEVENNLKTADWFNVKIFPQAVFTANNFTKIANNTYQAKGNLTIRDKTLPIVLTFVLDQYSNTKAHATGSTTLKRTAFGVGQGDWASTDEIKDDVKVDFVLDAVKK